MSYIPYVIEQNSRGAVSYTHLDVYKRQWLYDGVWNCKNVELCPW